MKYRKNYNTKVKGTKLLFSTKSDGDLPGIFYLKCDNKSNTSLIQAGNGRRFSGFAILPLCSIDMYKDNKQYKIDGKAIHCNKVMNFLKNDIFYYFHYYYLLFQNNL